MTPSAALASIPEEAPKHYRASPRLGWVPTVDQVKCLERAKALIEAALSEAAVGEIEGDWMSGAIDNIDLSIGRINERLAEREEAFEQERAGR